MNCEVRAYQTIGTFYNGDGEEQELSNVRCSNPRAVRLGQVWVCWEHLASEYGFETSAVLE